MAKPWKIPLLNPDENVSVCVKKILRTRFREMFSYERGAVEGGIEALHNMRVSSRRLQSVLKIFRDCFPKKKYKAHYQKIRTLIRHLGCVRDYDVFMDTLETARKPLEEKHRKAIDLLIAKQKNLRLQERKNLLKEFKQLDAEGYKEKFFEFAEHSL